MSDNFSPEPVDPLTLEFDVPTSWPAGLAIAFTEMMQKAIGDGFPIVVPVRNDATPEQVNQVLEDVQRLIQNAGLATPEPPA